LLLVAFLLVNAPNCHLLLVFASAVQGDAVSCNTRKVAAKARITGRDDKTVLSRAFEIPAQQQNRLFHLLLRVSSAIRQIFFVKHNDKHSNTTVKR